MNLEKIKISDAAEDIELLNELEKLCQRFLGEDLVMRMQDEIVICTFCDENKQVIIGVCCISMQSPIHEFSEIPYLYNYICNSDYKKYKPSVAIMNYIKEFLISLNHKEVDLHVDRDNNHAIQFYEKNKFVFIGKYLGKYKCYTSSLF